MTNTRAASETQCISGLTGGWACTFEGIVPDDCECKAISLPKRFAPSSSSVMAYLFLLCVPAKTWPDLLLFLAVISPFVAFGAFLLRFITTMTITITDKSLVVREEVIGLDQIVGCESLMATDEAIRSLSYKVRTGNRVVLPVPEVESLVQVTLADGRQVAFSSDDPEAVIQTLRRVCPHLTP